jgi:hypothetical protein
MLLATYGYDKLKTWQLSKSGKVLSFEMEEGPVSFVIFKDAKAIADLISEYVFEYHQILEALEAGGGEFVVDFGGTTRSRGDNEGSNEAKALRQRAQKAKEFIETNRHGKMRPKGQASMPIPLPPPMPPPDLHTVR